MCVILLLKNDKHVCISTHSIIMLYVTRRVYNKKHELLTLLFTVFTPTLFWWGPCFSSFSCLCGVICFVCLSSVSCVLYGLFLSVVHF